MKSLVNNPNLMFLVVKVFACMRLLYEVRKRARDPQCTYICVLCS